LQSLAARFDPVLFAGGFVIFIGFRMVRGLLTREG
jgi:hypothetical protein